MKTYLDLFVLFCLLVQPPEAGGQLPTTEAPPCKLIIKKDRLINKKKSWQKYKIVYILSQIKLANRCFCFFFGMYFLKMWTFMQIMLGGYRFEK